MQSEPRIIARWTDSQGNEQTAECINPSGWDDHLYILANADCYDPPMFAVEARNDYDAIDEFQDSEIGENLLRVEDFELEDYRSDNEIEPDLCSYNGGGVPVDTENLQMWEAPPGVRYHGEGLPSWGIAWKHYRAHLDGVERGTYDAKNALDWIQRRNGKSSYAQNEFDPTIDDPREPGSRAIYRESYARAFLSYAPAGSRGARAARLYLRIAGFPF
jgi:hypothetical protein